MNDTRRYIYRRVSNMIGVKPFYVSDDVVIRFRGSDTVKRWNCYIGKDRAATFWYNSQVYEDSEVSIIERHRETVTQVVDWILAQEMELSA